MMSSYFQILMNVRVTRVKTEYFVVTNQVSTTVCVAKAMEASTVIKVSSIHCADNRCHKEK